MTNNQINYMRVTEEVRHNLATEEWQHQTLAETNRHNVVAENISLGNLEELTRHNKETESLTARDLEERARHNQAAEAISWFQSYEAQRHNQVLEGLNAEANLLTSAYHQSQIALEREKYQAQLAVEQQKVDNSYKLGYLNYQVDAWNALTNTTNAETRAGELSEKERYDTWHLINESVSAGSNLIGSLQHAAGALTGVGGFF